MRLVGIAALMVLLASSAAHAGNLLVEPSFEDWAKAWTRVGSHYGSAHWDSRWLKRTDSHTGPGFMIAAKEAFDDVTPVDVLFFQSVADVAPGDYEASLWFKVGGEGDKWDGPGGADQWTRIVVYLWADKDRTRLVRTVMSPKIEIPVAEWHEFATRFTVPKAGVKSISFYCFARLVDRYPRAWAAWDDAYLGRVTSSKPEQPANLLTLDSFDVEGNRQNPTLQPDKTLRVTHAGIDSTYAVKTVPFDCGSGARRVRVSVECKAQDVVRGNQPWYGMREIIWYLGSDDKLLPISMPRSDVIPFIIGTRDWSRYEQTLVIPRGTAKLKVMLGIDHCSGTAWFRNARIEEVFDDYLVDEDSSVRVDVGKPTSTVLEGFGWNWETVTPDRHYPAEVALWPEFFQHMAWDGPEMLRVGVTPGMCPPKEYKPGADTGQHYTYNYDTPPIRNLCRLFEFCDSHKIDVLIANWNAGFGSYDGAPGGDWLLKGHYDGTGSKSPDWQMPYSKARMAEYLTELAYYFRVTKGFKCIKYVSVWNEPGYWNDIGQYPDGFLEVYKLLDAKLRARGIRDQVKTLGLEMVEGGSNIQKTVDILRGAPYIDVAAVHDYGAGLGVATATTQSYPLDGIIADTVPEVRALRSMRKNGVPVMMTETNGMGANGIYGPRNEFVACMGAVEYAVELVKMGFGGVLKWLYNQPGWCQFTPFRFEDGHARPNGGTYYPWAMLSRWTVRGSTVLDTRVTGGLDASGNKRVRSVALRSPGGEMTVIVVNDGRLPKSLVVRLPNAKGSWRHFYYDGTLSEFPRESRDVKLANGVMRALVPPESVNVFTTFRTSLTGDAPR